MLLRRVPVNWNRFVAPLNQRPTGQSRRIPLAPIRVKQPVFPHSECGIVGPFHRFITPRRSVRCYLQHKVRRFALLSDGVALLVQDPRVSHPESHQQIRDAHAGPRSGNIPSNRNFAQDDGSIRVAQMPAQRRLVTRIVQVARVHHIVTRRKVGKPGHAGRLRCLCMRRRWKPRRRDNGGSSHYDASLRMRRRR